MEAVMMKSSGDYKHQIRNSKRNFGNNRSLASYPSDNLLLTSFLAGGYYAGGGLPSYPPAVSVFRPPQNHRQQPPLLPLPILMPTYHQNMNLARSNSTSNSNIRSSPPPITKKIKNRARDHSLTPKKSKNQKKDLKKEESDPDLVLLAQKSSINEMIGPDPKDLPKVVNSRVFSSFINNNSNDIMISVDKFSGSVVFTPSPPPSSLPLPTFSLRPKLSCKAEAAAGIDAGATDSLRRLLRIR